MTIRRFLLALSLSVPVALASGAQPLPVVFKDVNVVSMTSPKVAKKMTVVVQNGTIQGIFPAGRALPANATVIEAGGKFLMPGLAEMHGHIPPANAAAGLLPDVLFLYLANGITTVRGMLGHPGQLDLRAQQIRGTLKAPNLYLAGPAFNGQTVNSVQDAIDRVRLQRMEGWDLLKVHGGLTRAEYDAMVKTARETGMRFGGHVPEDVGLPHALASGQETFDHMDGYVEVLGGDKGPVDENKLADLVKKSKAANAWIVPTSALWDTLFAVTPLETLKSYEELKFVPQSTVDTWAKMYEERKKQLPPAVSKNVAENRLRIFRALHKGGVKIVMGTDAPQQFSVPGFSLHREMQWMRKAGLTPYEILKTGTVNAGEYFAKQDSFGTVEPGRRADLVLLEANPLEDVANVARISGVMVRGRWYSRADLDEGLLAIQAKHQRTATGADEDGAGDEH
jgi:hypothetical protein